MTHDLLDFTDLEPVEVPVRLGGQQYVLAEASGDAAIKYRNAQTRASRYDAEGNLLPGEGMADTEALLISLCLYRATAEGKLPLRENKPDASRLVPAEVIRGWPNRVQKALFDRLQEMSGLDMRWTVASISEFIGKLEKTRDKLVAQEAARDAAREGSGRAPADPTPTGSA